MGRNLLYMTKIPHDDTLEGLCKLRIRESEKLKTVLELYDLETHQKKLGLDNLFFFLRKVEMMSQHTRSRNKTRASRSKPTHGGAHRAPPRGTLAHPRPLLQRFARRARTRQMPSPTHRPTRNPTGATKPLNALPQHHGNLTSFCFGQEPHECPGLR